MEDFATGRTAGQNGWSKHAQSENTRIRPCNAKDLTQEFLPPLLSMSVRNRVDIIVLLRSVVVTVPQLYCSQFRLEFCQSIRIHAFPWLAHYCLREQLHRQSNLRERPTLERCRVSGWWKAADISALLPSPRLLQICQGESTMSTTAPVGTMFGKQGSRSRCCYLLECQIATENQDLGNPGRTVYLSGPVWRRLSPVRLESATNIGCLALALQFIGSGLV
jgi:hypothetical protein